MQNLKNIFVIQHISFILTYTFFVSPMKLNNFCIFFNGKPMMKLTHSFLLNSLIGIFMFFIRSCETNFYTVLDCNCYNLFKKRELTKNNRKHKNEIKDDSTLITMISKNMNLEFMCCILFGLTEIFYNKENRRKNSLKKDFQILINKKKILKNDENLFKKNENELIEEKSDESEDIFITDGFYLDKNNPYFNIFKEINQYGNLNEIFVSDNFKQKSSENGLQRKKTEYRKKTNIFISQDFKNSDTDFMKNEKEECILNSRFNNSICYKNYKIKDNLDIRSNLIFLINIKSLDKKINSEYTKKEKNPKKVEFSDIAEKQEEKFPEILLLQNEDEKEIENESDQIKNMINKENKEDNFSE